MAGILCIISLSIPVLVRNIAVLSLFALMTLKKTDKIAKRVFVGFNSDLNVGVGIH